MPRKAKSVPNSAASIAKLKSQGFTHSQIAKAIGRDSSLISQIASGKKPGTNLAPALNTLASGRKPKQPARRTAKTGEAVRTRRSRVAKLRTPGMTEFIAKMEKIAANGGTVNLVTAWQKLDLKKYKFTAGENTVSLYGGIGQGSTVGAVNIGGKRRAGILSKAKEYKRRHPNKSDKEQLEGFLQAQLKRSFEGSRRTGEPVSAEGLKSVEFHAFYNDRKKSGR